jgi:hypothetical protein
MVVFSDKAYNAIIRETFEWDPVETGGILLGHILDNGCWIVMEVLPPGYSEGREGDNVHHEWGYFEYNQRFVNYLANSVATQYKIPLELLGLWHRHPGSMDCFSTTDDGTNRAFASRNPNGAISGLVNVDPKLRMTMYYISHNDNGMGRPHYQTVNVEVGSDLIPEEYFTMQYYGGADDDLHPEAPGRNRRQNQHRTNSNQYHTVGNETNKPQDIDIERILDEQLGRNNNNQQSNRGNQSDGHASGRFHQIEDALGKIRNNKILFFPLIAVFFCFFVYMFWHGVKSVWPQKEETVEIQQHEESDISRTVRVVPEKITLNNQTPYQIETDPRIPGGIKWESSNPNVVIVDGSSRLCAVANGEATVDAVYEGQCLQIHVIVLLPDEDVPEVEINNGIYSESCSLYLGQNVKLRLKCADENFDMQQLQWESKDETIVTVDQEGKVTPMAEGTTDICICHGDIVLDSIKITVKPEKND